MKIAGIDLSTHAVDVVLVPLDGNEPPEWRRYPLDGPSSFDRARTVRDAMPPRTGGLWDDVLAVGIEDPRGHSAGHAYRIQGAILSCLPASVLVQPWIPSAWRKAVGLKGNASKDDVEEFASLHALAFTSPQKLFWGTPPQDMYDAYCIAIATRDAITVGEAASVTGPESLFPSAACRALEEWAKVQEDGCAAVSGEWKDGKPGVVTLVATSTNPERIALLHALHESWYPETDDD